MSRRQEVTQHYTAQAKNTLKAELKRRGVTYEALAKLLSERGVYENKRNLENKISRGKFSTVFFLMVMDVIGARTLQLEA